jgi:hypothetical protein
MTFRKGDTWKNDLTDDVCTVTEVSPYSAIAKGKHGFYVLTEQVARKYWTRVDGGDNDSG